ncbi:zinc knuckle CX2CX4HX4C containing protein [Tanacetum coccineum]
MKDPDPKPPNIDSSSSVKLSKKLDKNVSSKPLRKSNRKNTIRMSSNGSTGKSLDEDGYGEEELEEMEVRDVEVIDTLYEVSNGDKASGVDNMGKNTEIPILVHLNFVLNPDLLNNVFSNNNLEIIACLRRKIGRIWKILLEAGLCLEPAKVPLWVKIFNIPVEARNAEGISRIARRVGTPIIMDRITTSMCEKAYGRASYARVLIEIDASEGLIDSINVVFGHSFEACKSRELTEVEILKKAESKGKQAQKVNEDQGNKAEWRSVSYKKVLKNAGGGYVNQEYLGGNRNVNYVESDITP